MTPGKPYAYRGAFCTCRWCGVRLSGKSEARWSRTEALFPPPGDCPGCTTGPNDDHVAGDWELVQGSERGGPAKYRCRRCENIAFGVRTKRIAQHRQMTKVIGHFGNGFFCSLRCGFDWAVKQLEEQRS